MKEHRMARQAVFQLGGKDYSCSISKLDRDRLYGWKEVIALDPAGQECQKGSLDPGGGICIPPGGKALGLLDPDGRWVNRTELQAYDTQTGNAAPLVPGIYDQPVKLSETVSLEEFLEHAIDTIYQIETEDAAGLATLVNLPDRFYTFPYNYRADYEGAPAFLVENEGRVYILSGYRSNILYSSPQDTVLPAVTETEDAGDEIDFGMI
jgi:hypothetical protein